MIRFLQEVISIITRLESLGENRHLQVCLGASANCAFNF